MTPVGTTGGLRSWGRHICCATAGFQAVVRQHDVTRMKLFLRATRLSAAKAATMAQFFYAFNELNHMSQVVDELTSRPIDGMFMPVTFPWVIG